MLEKMQYYKSATFSEREIVDRTKKIGVLRLAAAFKVRALACTNPCYL
jgi:hypothetical protein